jgi:glycosyltransferase involved in cell wall biosynthesis
VVDDGSTDGTAEIVGAYPSQVRRIAKENQGVARARNDGIRATRGKYVALLDADDTWMPSKLKLQTGLLEDQPEIGLCFTGALRVNNELEPIEPIPAQRHADYCEALLLHSMVVSGSCSSVMFRRHLADEVAGFDPDLSQCADWDFMIRMAQATRIAPIPDLLVNYRTGAGRMSSDVGLLERDTFAVLEKFFRGDGAARYAPKKRRIYSNHWMILAGSYLEAGARRDAVRCLMNGLRAYPPNVARPAGLPWRRLKRRLA